MASINARITEPDDRTIVIARTFDAPRDLVFKAWTDPKHIAQWWGPNGFSSPGCEMDLRVGGTFRVPMRAPDGTMAVCTGIFHEIVVPLLIVYTGPSAAGDACGAGLPPNAIVTVTFDDDDRQTTVTITTRLASAVDRAAAAKAGFKQGWSDSLERLAGYLATG